ncbi:glycine cleavage system protein GcvH [Serinibacter arcticus]|uniref:Glycine cleavage system H protein n=1 Tax=Serinibacter arcticus TaxID=1655435 RepID=A0A4Z1E515_9MICO|nr:glycine cleavage system protein GcvH [Serinibacter arcticus]TGO04827.1 Glycine cleavage system H protein [Serinibacter arcticus]
MSTLPADLSYTSEHEWVQIEGDLATVGITTYAADQLGEVVYVALPAVGDELTAGAVCGEVESHKSVSELFAPLGGVVSEVNASLEGEPELAGSDPFGSGWLFRVQVHEPDLGHLLSAEDYQAQVDALS